MRDVIADYVNVVQDIRERNDRSQIALNKLFGLTHQTDFAVGRGGAVRVTQGAEFPPGPGFESLREAYAAFTGDEDVLHFGKRVTQMVSTLNFASAFGNTVNNLLGRAYAEIDYRVSDIARSVTSAENFKDLVRSRMRFVGDLGEMAEDEPYDTVSDTADEKYSFAVTTFGGYLIVTRRAVLANNIQAIQRAVEQMARAAARTLAKRCWGRLINNDVYGVDALPVFHEDHGNLGAAALSGSIAESAAALNAARLALFAQVEPGSTERLGLGSGQLLLVVPIELEEKARQINLAPFTDTSSTPNPWFHRFGADCERIFVNPLLTSSTDWYLFDISGRVGILELAFLMGRQIPEVIVSDDPRRNPNLSQDRICYKMRFEFECAVEDYRGAYKSVVV
jgi:hypothetical protein